MTTITLPPLPRPDKVYSNRWGDGSDATYWYSPESLRARDLEVAKAVLEGAAELSDAMDYGLGDLSKAIRALEIKHHE